MGAETIARRYAGALADIAVESGNTESIKTELRSWDQMISSSKDLKGAFSNPSISHANKAKVLEALIAKSNPSKTTANFLRVLLQNSRLTELSAITEKLAEVVDDRSGVVSGSVTSARELTESEKSAFVETLRTQSGKEVRLTYEIDETLIGGAVTRVGSTVFDGSVRSRLQNLKDQMIKN